MPTVSAVQAEIEGRLRLHLDALTRGDAEGALQVFSPGAIVRPAHVEPLRGFSMLRDFFERTFAVLTVLEADFFTEELYLYDTQAFHFGTHHFSVLSHDGNEHLQKGSFAIVWKRQRDASWRFHRGILNSSLPKRE